MRANKMTKLDMNIMIAKKLGLYRLDDDLNKKLNGLKWQCAIMFWWHIAYYLICFDFNIFEFVVIFLSYLIVDILIIRGQIADTAFDMYKSKAVSVDLIACAVLTILLSNNILDFVFDGGPYYWITYRFVVLFRPKEVRQFCKSLPNKKEMRRRYKMAKREVIEEVNK